jgi:AmmeMemoRadiSam system protein B/AmmeMemoRadiSam system protein A
METSAPLLNKPSVTSGRFYSNHANKLEIEIAGMVKQARKLIDLKIADADNLLALVAPHAGYIFSGIVAASAFIQLEKITPRKRVFIIGSSHHTEFNGASVYNKGHYLTPFGKVKVDLALANKLIAESTTIKFVQEAHTQEHCIEVMLPFIQYFWKNEFEIIPIIIASHSEQTSEQLAKELKPYFNKNNLFIISTDLSHYPTYQDALIIDKRTIKATLTGNPDILLEQIKLNKKKQVPNLNTSMCGLSSVLTLLYLIENNSNTSIAPILYQNSGDIVPFGDKTRVVGYQSLCVTRTSNKANFKLTTEDQVLLIHTAKKSIEYKIKNKYYQPETETCSDFLLNPKGAFVSVYVENELRGCIGQIESKDISLIQLISELSLLAAFKDSRFKPITSKEINKVEIEISVLSALHRILTIKDIQLGKHGIYIKKGHQSGTFLPQVANKTNWTIEEFVGNCSKNKAGLGWDGWKTAELYTYEAEIFIG